MLRRGALYILAGLLLVAGLVAVYNWSIPRLVGVSPAADSIDAPANSELRLEFSRPMQDASVQQRLTITPDRQGTFRWQGNTLIFQPDSPWPAGAKVQVQLAAGALSNNLLAIAMPGETSWSFTVRSALIAYLYPSSGKANIFTIDPANGSQQQLTHEPGGVADFDVSKTGDAIFYVAASEGSGDRLYRLSLAQPAQPATPGAAGTAQPTSAGDRRPELILDCKSDICRQPKVSPKGDYLAFERSASAGGENPTYPQVWLLPLGQNQAGAATRFTPVRAGEADHQTQLPSWSPDGLLTFYDTTRRAFVVIDPTSGMIAQMENQTGLPGTWGQGGEVFIAPETIIPDEEVITATTDISPLAVGHLMRYQRSDGAVQDLTLAHDLDDGAPAFSPDGKRLVFNRKLLTTEGWTPGRQIWLLDAGGQEIRRLTDEPEHNHFDFAWSPSGERIAYVRFDERAITKPPEIWLLNLADNQTMQLVIGGYAPQWIP